MRMLSIVAAAVLAAALGACHGGMRSGTATQTSSTKSGQQPGAAAAAPGEAPDADARQLVDQAAQVVRDIKADPDARQLLEKAQGVFLVPRYAKGAAVVGARGGEGVLFAREGGEWKGPVFYDIGAISVGPQFGGSGGKVALLLMTPEAVRSFRYEDHFSLDADADLTLFDFSARAQGAAGEGDVVFWSDDEGAFAGVSLGVSGIHRDDDENQAYYHEPVKLGDVLSGRIASRDAAEVRGELSGTGSS